jgi:TPR repeat protein
MSNLSKIQEILKGDNIAKLKNYLYSAAQMLNTDMMIGIESIDAYKDMRKAFEACAENGMPEAWVDLGRMYIDGKGVKANRKKGTEYFIKSYREGYDLAARIYLEYLFWQKEDYKESQSFCKQLIAEGDKDGYGNYFMGLMKYSGKGCKPDGVKAFTHHEQAAMLGLPDAMFELYVLLSTGQGCEQDNETAVEWCKKAAEKGQDRACFNMGSFYATGNGVDKNLNDSFKWYREAALNGHGKAAATIGVMMIQGDIKPESDDENQEYFFSLAEENGFDVDGWLNRLGIER